MASAFRKAVTLLQAPATEVAFALRSAVHWSRGPASLANEAKADAFAFLAGDERRDAERDAAILTERFALAPLAARSTQRVWLANLALLSNLDALAEGAAVPCSEDGIVRAADVGCGDFHYATALARWLAGAPQRPIVLRGIEVDGHGVHRDGHSRADHARAHAALAERSGSTVAFEVADFVGMALPEQDVVCLLFPFLSTYASLRWGLPLSRLRPRRLVARAVASVRPGGWLLCAHQTDVEAERMAALLADQPVERLCRRSFATVRVPWSERTAGQLGTLWRRL